VIIHHLRIDGQATQNVNQGDIWGLDGGAGPVSRVVIDHCTAIASSDGVFDIYGDVKDASISWNIITNTAYALNIIAAGGETRDRISIHHNVFAKNNERQVRVKDNTRLDYVNNVVYGWGWFEGLNGSLFIVYDQGAVNPSLNVEDNVLLWVATPHGDPNEAIYAPRGVSQGQVYYNGNLLPPQEGDNMSTGGRNPIPSYAEVTHFPAGTLWTNVLPSAGTHYPTAAEQALLAEVAAALPKS